VCGQPFVVLDADWSKHERRQVNIHDALLGQLVVVKVTAFVVMEIGNDARLRAGIFVFAPSFDAANKE